MRGAIYNSADDKDLVGSPPGDEGEKPEDRLSRLWFFLCPILGV